MRNDNMPVNYEESGKKDSMSSAASKATMWAVHGSSFFPCEETIKELKPAQYKIEYDESRGVYFTKTSSNMDDLLLLPDNTSSKIMDQLEVFWKKKDLYQKNGLIWKRGVLLYGKPGCGKTTTVQLISKRIEELNGVSFFVSVPRIASSGLQLFRKIEPDRPIVVILEDLDAIIENYGESEILSLLDGENQVNNVVYIATTNYLSDLDPRIINRPSRFDMVSKINFPDRTSREFYLKEKVSRLKKKQKIKVFERGANGDPIKKEVDELSWILDNTEDFSIAHLKEYIIATEILEENRQIILERLKHMGSINDIEGTSL